MLLVEHYEETLKELEELEINLDELSNKDELTDLLLQAINKAETLDEDIVKFLDLISKYPTYKLAILNYRKAFLFIQIYS